MRVIDFFPPRLENFAVGRRSSIFNRLPDFSGGEDTDRSGDLETFRQGGGFGERVWEWRFALKVEDAGGGEGRKEPKKKGSMWVLVDNHAAQGLLNIEEDATCLRTDKMLLERVKEQLFKLWGDLEERKAETLSPLQDAPLSSFASDSPMQGPQVGAQPDVDSDVEDAVVDVGSGKRQPSVEAIVGSNGEGGKSEGLKAKNKAFTCCIKQYGIKVREEEKGKMDAGEGWRWQRMFGLFGTTISE